MKGAKLVLFVTGLCRKRCYYCPISEKRGGKDKSWANELEIKSPDDIIEEAGRMRALGAGVTGGEPAMRLERAIDYIGLLKGHFDPFHVHMYTAYPLDGTALRQLKEAGLDELRFHFMEPATWKSIDNAARLGIETGIEIPAIPGQEKRIVEIAKRLKETGGSFLNLNELEFSETNTSEFKKRCYELKSELSHAVAGSEETAKNVQKSLEDFELAVHYCSSSFKDGVQLKKRLIRTAKNVKKDFEEVSDEGLLLKGVIVPVSPKTELASLRRELIDAFEIPENLISVDTGKMRIETTQEVAEALSRQKELKCFIVEEYPTSDRLETDVIPLDPDQVYTDI
jgi:pyruvate formate-lyase activating enzyme-like uncharacterized protein